MNSVTGTVTITSSGVTTNGKTMIANSDALSFGKLCRKIYKESAMDYPKFYKMDGMSKLGFLAAEILLAKTGLTKRYNADRIAVITTTQSGCFETDSKFAHTIEKKDEWYPAPALFVYTLPNIVTGEICIRHGVSGENCCFVEGIADPEKVINYTNHLFSDDKIDAAIVGLIEYSDGGFKTILHTVEREEKTALFDFTNALLQVQWKEL